MRPLIPLTPAALPLSSFGAVDGRGDALRGFRRAFGRSRQPEAVQEQRAAALEAIGALDSLEAAEALLPGYRQLEREVLPLEEKREKYLRRRVVIHTIGLGQQIPKRFLRRLAEENGGTFVHEGV